MKRIGSAIGVAALIGVFALTGCGGGSSSNSANAMYTWISNESDRAQWQAFVDGVKESDPEFNLEMEGPSFQDYWTKVKTRMSASDAPCILATQAARAQELKELLAPLDELVASNNVDMSAYNEAMLKGLTVDGKLRAIPYDAAPLILYYNKDLFDQAGLEHPGKNYTWDQFVADAKALTNGDVYGVSIPPIFQTPASIVYANGGAVVENGELKLTEQTTVDSIQDVFDLAAKHKVMKAPLAADAEDIQLQTFRAGKAAMIIDGPWVYDSLVSTEGLSVGMAVVPSRSGESIGMVQGSGFGISEKCADKETAFQNIMKMTTPDVMRYVARSHGNVPAIDAAFDGWAEGKDPNDVEIVKYMTENAKTYETTENWQQLEVEFTQNVSNGYTGEKSAQEILTSLENSIK